MDRSFVEAVAISVRHFRKELSLSQEELAEKSGLDRTYISGVERGVRNITLESLELIVRALEVDVKSFFEKVTEEVCRPKKH